MATPSHPSEPACNRIFVSEVPRWQKKASGLSGGETGSVTFVQRFNATLGSFLHFHVVALDGVVHCEKEGDVVFHPGPAPSRHDIALVADRVQSARSLVTSPAQPAAGCSTPRERRKKPRAVFPILPKALVARRSGALRKAPTPVADGVA